MSWMHFKTQFNLSIDGAASGESASDVVNDPSKRGTGRAGYDEFLQALETHFATTADVFGVHFSEETRTQVLVGDFAV